MNSDLGTTPMDILLVNLNLQYECADHVDDAAEVEVVLAPLVCVSRFVLHSHDQVRGISPGYLLASPCKVNLSIPSQQFCDNFHSISLSILTRAKP